VTVASGVAGVDGGGGEVAEGADAALEVVDAEKGLGEGNLKVCGNLKNFKRI